MDAVERFLEVNFNSIKLNISIASSLLRRVPKMSILKTMPPPSLLMTTLIPEKIPLLGTYLCNWLIF